ncbi:MAG TPA: transposase, partial [Methylocella sp.]|nr:transposase [Methylocella sp.]
LAKRFAILTSIPGVSRITAFALLIEMPELGTLEARQAASLAGLAPVAPNPDAGPAAPSSAAGQRPPGPRHASPRRRALQPDLKAKYTQFVKAGKPAKLALTALMRKRIVLANALLRARRTWTPKLAS